MQRRASAPRSHLSRRLEGMGVGEIGSFRPRCRDWRTHHPCMGFEESLHSHRVAAQTLFFLLSSGGIANFVIPQQQREGLTDGIIVIIIDLWRRVVL
jgi:hypothetical protein